MSYQVKVNGQMLPEIQTLEQIQERAGRWARSRMNVEIAAAGTQMFQPLDRFLSSAPPSSMTNASRGVQPGQFDAPFLPPAGQPPMYTQPGPLAPGWPAMDTSPVYPAYQTPSEPVHLSYASIGKRFAALLIDQLIFVGIFIVYSIILGLSNLLASYSEGVAALVVILDVLFLLAASFGFGIYNIYLLGRDGATLGKRMMKLKVLDASGKPIGFGRAFLRMILQSLSGFFFGLGYLLAVIDSERRTFHDQVVGTHVYE